MAIKMGFGVFTMISMRGSIHPDRAEGGSEGRGVQVINLIVCSFFNVVNRLGVL
jgi:hypothetical protein